MQLKTVFCSSRNLISFINNFSAYQKELKKQLYRVVDIFMDSLLFQLQSWFINQTIHSEGKKKARQIHFSHNEPYTYIH